MCATIPWATCWRAIKRARGMNVLHPMGWDAFGLPAENAAMQNEGAIPAPGPTPEYRRHEGAAQIHGPVARLDARIRHLRRRLLPPSAGSCSSTSWRPAWSTRKKSKVNWDPVDMTVLANEQVIDGRGWRSGALVEQRELTQWFLKISDYAEDLLTALDALDRLARKGAHHAAQLDRQVRGPAPAVRTGRRRQDRAAQRRGLHHPARHHFRRLASSPCRPIIRWPPNWPPADPALADFIAECHATAPPPKPSKRPRRRGHFTGLHVKHPVIEGRDPAGLCRQFRADGLWHRRHFRLPGA